MEKDVYNRKMRIYKLLDLLKVHNKINIEEENCLWSFIDNISIGLVPGTLGDCIKIFNKNSIFKEYKNKILPEDIIKLIRDGGYDLAYGLMVSEFFNNFELMLKKV